MARPKRDPKTKEDILNRMLSYDFDGDIRHLGEEPAQITRTGAHTLRLTFPASGRVFDVSVHRPREFAQPRPAPVVRQPAESRAFKQEPETPEPEQPLTRGQKAAATRAARKAAGFGRNPREEARR